MTEHRIMNDLGRSETLLAQLQTDIIDRDEEETASDIVYSTEKLDQVIYILSRLRYDVTWRANRGLLHKETNDDSSQPEDISAPR